MNIERRSLLYIIVTLTLALSLVGIVSAEDPALSEEPLPDVPHAFYGAVTISSEDAPVGTEIEARGEGVMVDIEGNPNPITTTEVGRYGGEYFLYEEQLVVQGVELEDGDPIEFYVDGVRAQCREADATEWEDTYPFESGETTELDLRAEAPMYKLYLPFVVNGASLQ